MASEITAHPITSRPIQSDADFWSVRNLLIETYALTPPGFNWEIRRWDGAYYHNEEAGWDARWGRGRVRLWETAAGRLVGAAHPESRGEAFLEIHPDYRHLEEEMIAWAEDHLAEPTAAGAQHRLDIFVYEYDCLRQRVLERRGYTKLTRGGVMRRLRFGNKRIPEPAIAEGYVLRTTRPDDERDCQSLADLYNAAFRRSIHTAKELRTFMALSPSYRCDLDLVAEAPDGSLAAQAALMYDEANRFGLFEPVCTHPDHLRKGLASALIYAGLHRIREHGATDVYVGTGDQVAANLLYESVGFTEVYRGYVWHKVF